MTAPASRILLAQYGDFLASRLLGSDARELVETAIGDGQLVIVDFSGIDGISLSFADEFAGKLAAKFGIDVMRKFVRFANVPESVGGLLQMSIANRLRKAPPSAA